MFEKVNLRDALIKERDVKRESQQNATLSEFKRLFEAEWEIEKRLVSTLKKGSTSSVLPSAKALPEDKIFTAENIKSLCIDYRLRFLSTKYFKGEIPRHALASIKETEAKTGQTIDSFMIVAPSKLFKLEDVNSDPLLFAPLDDGRFFLIDKWGKDMVWYRKLASWPVKTPVTLLTTVVVFSALLAAIVPGHFLTNGEPEYFNFMRLIAFGWNVIFSLGIVSYFWFASHAKFSVHAWNSKYFN